VPALVLVGGLAIHRAIATSLPVIYAISVAAVSSHLLTGQTIPLQVTTWFVAGGHTGTGCRTVPWGETFRASPAKGLWIGNGRGCCLHPSPNTRLI
jgi:uncharacterized membrane protein YfcA